MSVVSRGVRNSFRNGLRTSAVVLILAISIGLSLSMLVANKAVEGRIAELKTEVDRTVVVNPAGSQGFQGGGEPLTVEDFAQVEDVQGVEAASGFLNFMLQTEREEGESGPMIMGRGGVAPGDTNLESAVDPGTLGHRFSGDSSAVPNFKLPIRGIGTTSTFDQSGKAFNVIDGRLLGDDDTYNAVVGNALAKENDLSVGSTFTAYDKTFTVVGIVDQETQFGNDTVIIPLKTAQELTGLAGEVSTIVAQAESIEELEAVISGIKETLGSDKADVTSGQENVREAIESLKSVQDISIFGFIAALAAAGTIVLMVMFVIVRERRREIGVLKAIGGSNRSIVSQFVVEAVVLVAIGGIIGVGTAFLGSGAVTNALVSSNTSSGSQSEAPAHSIGGGPVMRTFKPGASGGSLQGTADLVGDVTTDIGIATLLYGFLGMVAVAAAGSAIPAWLIAKVRPAEVLRGE